MTKLTNRSGSSSSPETDSSDGISLILAATIASNCRGGADFGCADKTNSLIQIR